MANASATYVCLLILCLAIAAAHVEAATPCATIVNQLATCLPYAQNATIDMAPSCCEAVRALNSTANTTADVREACLCIRSLVPTRMGIKPVLLNDIPSKCGVNMSFKFTPTLGCVKVGL